MPAIVGGYVAALFALPAAAIVSIIYLIYKKRPRAIVGHLVLTIASIFLIFVTTAVAVKIHSVVIEERAERERQIQAEQKRMEQDQAMIDWLDD